MSEAGRDDWLGEVAIELSKARLTHEWAASDNDQIAIGQVQELKQVNEQMHTFVCCGSLLWVAHASAP